LNIFLFKFIIAQSITAVWPKEGKGLPSFHPLHPIYPLGFLVPYPISFLLLFTRVHFSTTLHFPAIYSFTIYRLSGTFLKLYICSYFKLFFKIYLRKSK